MKCRSEYIPGKINLTTEVSWEVTSYRLVNSCRFLGEAKRLRRFSNYLTRHAATSQTTWLFEPQIS
jgi:hypothetical protein